MDECSITLLQKTMGPFNFDARGLVKSDYPLVLEEHVERTRVLTLMHYGYSVLACFTSDKYMNPEKVPLQKICPVETVKSIYFRGGHLSPLCLNSSKYLCLSCAICVKSYWNTASQCSSHNVST